MSVIESLLNLPVRKASDNVCRFCQKKFCCMKCRDRHVDKVHPGLNANCSLCASKTLSMRQFEFKQLLWEDKQLWSHIAGKHLPLRCTLCENLFETGEDLKSVGACKRYSEHRQALLNERLLRTPASKNLELKLQRAVSDIRYNSHTFSTPFRIYRNTSTPMFIGQKNSFEYQTPNAPNFSLNTPKTISPPIAQNNATSKLQQTQEDDSDTKFFSFSLNIIENEGTTPSRDKAEQQFLRSNSGRKLDIKESNEIVCDEAEVVHNDYTTSPVDMDLTDVEDNISQEHTPKPSVGGREESIRGSDVVKKVRFSDQYETLPEYVCQTEMNMTEEDDDVFLDANDVSGIKNTKDTKGTQDTKNTKNVNSTKNTDDTKDAKKKDTKQDDTKETKIDNVQNIEVAKDEQVKDQKRSLIQSPMDLSGNKQVNISQENKQNAEKENRVVEVLPNGVSTMTQKGASRVLMMVLVENNSRNIDADLMPLISSGLKKLEEQITLPSSGTSEFVNVTNATGYTRRSTTKLEMNISTVETCSNNNNNMETMTDHRQVVPAFPLSSVENDKSSSNGGILSAVAQAVKLVFRNLSGVTSSNIENSQVTQQQQIVGSTESLPETSTRSDLDKNLEIRYGKRARDVNEMSSSVDSVPSSWNQLDIRSPLLKRKREWYKIKGRRPIHSVRNSTSQVKSPRGVSSETQVFSQGSLTVGDTILPLPARAHTEAPVSDD